IEHIRLHADSLGIDPTRLGALGISSGGYLALQAALSIDPVERSENDLKAVVAIMPITDLRTIPPDETLFGVRHMDFDPALIPGLSPINFVTPDDPPTLLIHGSRDAVVNLQSNSQALERLLNQSVVNSRLLIVDAGHEIFPEPVMQLSHEAMLEWFEAHL
ncbi:MAG: prolyl oligopeptidase family serine peptidase, partial [Planctomycetaceae bacterium]|nr:prolyl oligopeptidase family serine peptidase [Planctomycetaceae bacterium]